MYIPKKQYLFITFRQIHSWKQPSFKSNYSIITCHLIHSWKQSTTPCIYLKSSYHNTKPTTHPTKFPNSLPLPVSKSPKNSRIKTILHQSLFNLNPWKLVIWYILEKQSTTLCIYLKSHHHNTKPNTHPTKFKSLPLSVKKPWKF